MIRTDAEYRETKEKLRNQEDLIRQQREQLANQDLSEEEAQNILEPMVSLRDQLRGEVKAYERIRDGDFPEIRDLQDLHKWLIGGRIAKKWTLSELADALDVSVQQVSRDEKNEYHSVTLGKADRILRALGIEFRAEVIESPMPDEGDSEFTNSNDKTRAMTRLPLADATDLQNWANRRDAQGQLPKLMRRLIYATNRSVSRLRFDSKKGVQSGGWDGVVKAEQSSPFVPSGSSFWELGTGKDPKEKANEDYRKRTEDPLGASPSESTFIFVTPRRWTEKEKWERKKEESGPWHEVRVYDADDLASWLEHAPAVYAWISNLIGYSVDQVESLSAWWNRWAGATDPSLSPELVVGGRTDISDKICSWVEGSGSSFTLEADSREEALAFFGACMYQLPKEKREDLLSRCLIIRDSEAWRKVNGTDGNLLLIPLFDSSGEVAEAVRNDQSVFVPRSQSTADQSVDATLPRLKVDKAQEALEEMGLEGANARNRAKTARRSLLSLRRLMATDPALKHPDWAQGVQRRSVLPALLAGRWLEGKTGDEEAISKLAGTSYEEYSRTVTNLASQADPPVRKVGSVWLVASKFDAWRMIEQALTDADLQRFSEVVRNVLGTADPTLDLPEEERWITGAKGRERPHSSHLREGLADTLALMASYDSTAQEGLQDRVSRIVGDLFEQAEGNADLWASLSDVLPLLSEAAPQVFIKAVDRGVSGDEPLLSNLFTDDESSYILGPSSPHTGLLWAIENLAWNERYLGDAIRLLGSLTRIDPGGRLANRPANSLRRIFVLWLPQTTASLNQRLDALDMLRSHEPEVAWRLMESILPKNHDSLSPNHKPTRRTWGWDARSGVPYAEVAEGVSEIVSRMLEDINQRSGRWEDLISNLGTLSANQQNSVLQKLRKLAEADLDSEFQKQIYDALRDLISKHRRYPDADWSLPASRIDSIENLTIQFEEVSLANRAAHLFNHGTLNLSDGEDWEERQESLNAARNEAIGEAIEKDGIETVTKLATEVDQPEALGRCLGRIRLSGASELSFLENNLTSSRPHEKLARGYIVGLLTTVGREEATEVLRKGMGENWTNASKASYLLALPADDRTWELLSGLDSDVEERYWSQIAAFAIQKEADAERAARQFLEYDRPHDAATLLGHRIEDEDVPHTLVADVLNQSIRTEPPSGNLPQSFKHDASELLEYIRESDEVSREKIASLEWGYLPLFHPSHGSGSAKLLHQELARSPDFFAEVVSFVYKPESRDDEETSEMDQTKARLGYQLLESWETVPGREGDSIDEVTLRQWIDEARSILKELDRLTVGDQHIGRILQHGPEPQDGKWPSEPIRNVIEEVESEDIETGFHMEVHNSRGVHAVSAERERSLAEKYRRFAENVRTRWPRTAQMLRDIAKDFERNARRYETQTELREDLR